MPASTSPISRWVNTLVLAPSKRTEMSLNRLGPSIHSRTISNAYRAGLMIAPCSSDNPYLQRLFRFGGGYLGVWATMSCWIF